MYRLLWSKQLAVGERGTTNSITYNRMDGKEVPPFALTYLRQMTGEIGYMRQEGYEFWHVFAQQAL